MLNASTLYWVCTGRRTVSHGKNSTLQQGKSVRTPSLRRKKQWRMCDELTTFPIPCPQHLSLAGRENRE